MRKEEKRKNREERNTFSFFIQYQIEEIPIPRSHLFKETGKIIGCAISRTRYRGVALSILDIRKVAKGLQDHKQTNETMPLKGRTARRQIALAYPLKSGKSADGSLKLPEKRFTHSHLAQLKFILPEGNGIKKLLEFKFSKVFHMASKSVDADQRITQDLEKLTTDLSGLVTGLVKPTVDILWFTWRMKLLTGQREVAILYVYMLHGLGFLRVATPDFGDLISQEQQLEGIFRFMHERLCTPAESVAFFGGGAREKAMVESRFSDLLTHSQYLLKKKWLFGELAHALRFLASVVSQSFLAFGNILELNRKLV
ncbi:hypothetical protein TSUD_397250 [Trifolium subterraneum]|uniref:ABC transmembrane type-1 domain-containing protein n=1 Tax=Trifolium subterraneum TaxID=3900 RepID=A0A2Z6N4P4_TRISU|nr:hypothetical protein TSUD_397250 [Trifolium subterraneum]